MKKRCMCCFNEARYISNNSSLALCPECYTSMADDFEASMEDEIGMPFDEYYDIEEIDDME